MNNPIAIQLLADDKINEAECMYANGHYDSACYIAGYAVELCLKARICQVLKRPDFFDFGNRPRFANEENITKPYKVHDFIQLLILSGLSIEHDNMMNDQNFMNDWLIIADWSENQRYKKGKKQQDTINFINSVKNYTSWIKQFL